ncbi:MAG: M56 family metallopeptidase, partial [Bacteroidaceae bacterium]|nr:M56 family metallopeptidase [Bacteroidaceae bacterium]
MTTLLTYILKWALSLAVLYLPFALLLRKETFATLNRRLLLCIIVLSAILPSVIVTYPVNIELPSEKSEVVADETVGIDSYTPGAGETLTHAPQGESVQESQGIKEWITARNVATLYLAGVAIALLLWMASITRTLRCIRCGTIWIDRQNGMTIHCHANGTAPFSFFGKVVISQGDYDECSKEILLHEEGHIRHGHSYDMLFISIIKAFQWFNPFIYLLANDMKEIHEFEADRYVLQKNGDARAYQLLILKKAAGEKAFPLANNFGQSSVRKRIKMMARKESNNSKRCKWLYLLPVSALYIGAFAQPRYIYNRKSLPAESINSSTIICVENSEGIIIEEDIIDNRTMPVAEIVTIPYGRLAKPKAPKKIAAIEVPEIKEAVLPDERFCEYIDLETSSVCEALKATGLKKCDMKVRFTTGSDGRAKSIHFGSCNVTTPGRSTPAEIENIKTTATMVATRHITAKEWQTGGRTTYEAHMIFHHGPSME